MKKFLSLSKYHIIVLVLYAVATPLFFVFLKDKLNYNLSNENLTGVIFITLTTILAFLYFLRSRIALERSISLSKIVPAVLYGMIFALPEEIIFRGLFQGYLASQISNAIVIIFLGAAIFGLAHLLNGANGYSPSKWNWKLARLTFLAGVPLGALFLLTNSLLIPTLLHAFFVVCLKLFTKK